MPSAIDPKTAALLRGMLNLKLFVIFSAGKGLDLTPYLADHLEYMIDLERKGKLFASGPIGNPTNADGMTVVRARDLDEAHEIARREPFVANGIRTYRIEPWTVMEGSLSFRVNFSDQSSSIA